MLQNSIYSAVVRFDDSKNRFNCASTNTCNGLVVLINPHLESVSIETIADAIVHEMTHNLFDLAELYEPSVPTKFHPRVIKSPWTGRMLDPNTYIQACYTWFGLKNFWQKAYLLHQSENANYYLKQSLKGFASTDFINIAKSEDIGFDQRVITTLESLQ
jgi:HEXXH motif-containing protein